MRITASRMRRIIKEEAGRLLAEAENPYYFSDEGEGEDEDPNFFDDGSDDNDMLNEPDEGFDFRGMEDLVGAYDDLINAGRSKQEIIDFITKNL